MATKIEMQACINGALRFYETEGRPMLQSKFGEREPTPGEAASALMAYLRTCAVLTDDERCATLGRALDVLLGNIKPGAAN